MSLGVVGAFQSLGATLLGFIRGGERLPNDCQEGGIWGRSFRTQSCLSPLSHWQFSGLSLGSELQPVLDGRV